MKKVVIGIITVTLVVIAGCLGMYLGNQPPEAYFPEDEGVTSSVPSQRPGTIREGTWEVGTDVKPGKYKTSGAVASAIPLCYWDVKKNGEITSQGVKDKVGAQGIATLRAGETFTTNGCEPWYLDDSKAASWTAPKTTPIKDRKVYVVETLPASWPVASAQAWIDRYTGSNWVMSKTCPASAYRCIFVKRGNLTAPRLAETRGYSSSRVTIIVDLPYANPRVKSASAKRWVLVHEFGHAAGLAEHRSACSNFMHATTRCMGYGVTASQRRSMSTR